MAKKKMSLGVIGTAIVMASYGVWKSQENKIKSLIPARVGSFGDIIFQVNSRTVLTPKKRRIRPQRVTAATVCVGQAAFAVYRSISGGG